MESSGEVMKEMLGVEISGDGISGFGSGSGGSGSGMFDSGEEDDGSEEDDAANEFVEVPKDYYIVYIMRFMAVLHSIVSLAMLVAYYHLKVSLLIKKYMQIKLVKIISTLFNPGTSGHL